MEITDLGNPGLYKENHKRQEEVAKENNHTLAEEKPPTCFQNTNHYIREFCSRTTVHGFTYLGEKGRTIPERIWWLVTILVALYLCISLIAQTYQKWMNSPVIVTFATSQTPIWKIPFPGVTICPEVKSRKSRFNYTAIYLKKLQNQQLTELETKEFEYMSMVCDSPKEFVNKDFKLADERPIDFLMEVAPHFNKTVLKVQWKGQVYKDVTELFSPILSSEGLCYTFNLVDRSDIFKDIVTHYKDSFSTKGKRSRWSVETGYDDEHDLDAYPRRTVSSGVRGGLRISFRVPKVDLDYACLDSVQGFKVNVENHQCCCWLLLINLNHNKFLTFNFLFLHVVVHNPTGVPRGRNKYFRVPLDQSVIASIKPNMMRTADELKNYKPKDRQCYFTSERNLKYFKIYNQPNCLNECLVDFILKSCGCVMFYMQRTNSTPMCGPAMRKCVKKAKAVYLEEEFKSKLKSLQKNLDSANSLMQKCKCLPSCNALNFEVQTSQAEWNWRKFLEIEHEGRGSPEGDSPDDFHYAMLTMFFKDLQFITSERNELYGQTDFWASCGGLLGLFTGFSFLSAVELLYYLTLRLLCNFHLFGRRYWSGSEQLLTEKTKAEDKHV